MFRQSVSPLRSMFAAGPVSRVVFRQQQARYNSTLTKITERASSAVATTKSFIDTSIYWSKVIAEVSKEVYLKEAFTPPQIPQVVSTFKSVYAKILPVISSPEAIISLVRSINGTAVFKFTGYTMQVLGAFSLGEIIGRRKLVGY
ncbi:mitochondrial ATP synthase g subunit-domain-containing protein [Lipomyces arxii]|uniref:mitochondrial ATP synthase g subunit-domain-containing protein n=1 Tax=Lipomyces arxii TaxID=56418 RepID=UPI0034CE9B93